uniref:NADH-ubiquinone oxidoreductase chain 5 n=1 Tax=Aeluroscalabotes felinus TaxID=96749 RepID=A0A1Y1CCS5_AELFE|nr:NADH dehydrogenase subunit 5 [Aeluroscalabotes felinus]BAX77933.1 NADH dehydrogenase subunit 5 [Aeluroscalabotes felinus]
MLNLMFHTTTTLTLLVLLLPFLFPRTMSKLWTNPITTATKLACMMSMISLATFISTGVETITTSLTWLNSLFSLQISLMFDRYSTSFLPIALFITWTIMEFTNWYMNKDFNRKKFMKYLLLFLLAMFILITANNLFQLFIGWEGVGIMSFLLIGWWFSRMNANSAALQAMIYNRIGDIGLLLSLSWFAMYYNTWNFEELFSLTTMPLLPLLGIILAAAGKSAQFGLHPWLPNAMEGPTPVSALLHSSTMVVAGVFLLIRLNPLLQMNSTTTTICLCLGATTTVFSALCALTQNDLKKIIAFSTSSQLGLMMVAIGLNQPDLAFLHISTHAFFKAMLFLCSGSIIHSLSDEQDIRKMGNLQKTLPITMASMTLGSLALIGIPFLAGFYSKDMIIEALNTTHTNAWALMLTLLATALTAAYSFRMMFYTQMNTPHYLPLSPTLESNKYQIRPILYLGLGTLFSGFIITMMMMPMKTQIMTMNFSTKLMTLLITTIGLLVALDLTKSSMTLSSTKPTIKYNMLNQLGFFNILTHRTIPQLIFNLSQKLAYQLNDLLWYEKLGPKMLMDGAKKMSNLLTKAQTGLMKTYLTIFMITMMGVSFISFYTER